MEGDFLGVGDILTTNRITVDIDKNIFLVLVSFFRFLILFRKFPKIRKTKRGFHLSIYLPYLISDSSLKKYRLLLFDDRKRIFMDDVPFKPKQVLFDEKKLVLFDGKYSKVLSHRVSK